MELSSDYLFVDRREAAEVSGLDPKLAGPPDGTHRVRGGTLGRHHTRSWGQIANGDFEAGNTGFSAVCLSSSTIQDFHGYTNTRDPRAPPTR